MQKLHLNIQNLMLLSILLILCLSIVSCDEPTENVVQEPITVLPDDSDVDELIALNDKEDVNQQTVELEDFSDYLSEDSEKNVEKELKPITVTDDDYDLKDDSDDLPEDVEMIAERKTPNAYYFVEDRRKNILDDPENTAKGVETTTTTRQVRQYNAIDEMFFVVAGAFRTEKNAQKKMTKLLSLGYTPKMIQFSDSEFQTVCVAKFKGQPDADSVVTELTEEYNIDAYVVKRRQ